MITNQELTDQLVQFYYFYDAFQSRALFTHEVRATIECLLNKGRIVTVEDDGKLVGYMETWRINFEQFGRIICKIPFHVDVENINDGNILYVANVTIKPEYRRSKVLRSLRNRVFEQNQDAEYFVGEANRKKRGLVKVFKASEINLSKGKCHVK